MKKSVTKSDIENFYDAFGERQRRDFIFGNERVSAAISLINKFINKSTRTIADIGCGCGQIAWELASENRDLEVHGYDISPKNIKIANAIFDRPNLRYFVSDLSSPPDEPFDVLCLIDVYEHIPKTDWPGFNRVLAECLKPNGVLILTTPTPIHQNYLRNFEPASLQVIDETVERKDLFQLADDIGAQPIFFEWKSIWKKYDYTHFVCSRTVDCYSPIKSESKWSEILSRKIRRLYRKRLVNAGLRKLENRR